MQAHNPNLADAIGEEVFTMSTGDSVFLEVIGLPPRINDEALVKAMTIYDPSAGKRWTCQPLHKLKDSAPNKKNMLVRAAWKPPKNVFNLVWGDSTYPVCVRDHQVPKHKQCPIAKAAESNGLTSDDAPASETKMTGGGLAALEARPKARAGA